MPFLALLKLVPTSVWIGLGVAIAALAGYVYLDRGWCNHACQTAQDKAVHIQSAWDEDKARVAKVIAAEKARQSQVIEKVVVEYRDRTKIVKEKGDEIVKEVHHYLPADSACNLPAGWRVYHDAAAVGQLPDNPAGAIGEAQEVDPATAAETVATNYASCNQTAERLIAIQSLVTQLSGGDPK